MENLLILIGVIVIVLAIFGASGFLLMLAWNVVMPFLFHLPTINFFQALGLSFLIACLKGIFSVTVSK